MKILFNYTTRTRPEWFERGLNTILQNVESDNFIVLVSIDLDDHSMREMVKKYITHDKIRFVYGTSKNKIDAINRDVDLIEEWDILVNMSDDMIFTVQGFDNIIREYFDTLDKCLHFPDGYAKDIIITMSILGREYYNRFGYVYHPDYCSLYCDNETTDVAKILKKYRYIPQQIFEHLHPVTGAAEMDAQYHHTESFHGVDRETYEARKARNFDL